MNFADLPPAAIFLTGFILFLSLVLPVICLARVVRFPGAGRFVVSSALLILISAPVTFGVERLVWSMQHPAEPVGALVAAIGGVPAWLPVCAAAVLFPAAGINMFCFVRWGSRILSDLSTYEGLDYLPEGVCVFDSQGLPVLVNDQMHEILYAAFGLAAMDMNYMGRLIARNELEPGCSAESYSGGTYLRLPDGKIWDLREKPVTTAHGSFTEMLAFDVTDLYNGNEKLRERNERLAAVNEQIREYSRNMDSIVREREILRAKIRLHDDFGKTLLAIRRYLSGQTGDREALLSQLKTPVFLFRPDSSETPEDDPIALLGEAAAAIGVTMHYDGDLPPVNKEVLCTAIHECLTNTVKHANGCNLYVKTSRENGVWQVEFTNDGDPPAGPLNESGGLANLRQLAESHGVNMHLGSAPVFRMILEF